MHLISVVSNISVQPNNDHFIQDPTASAASLCTESYLSVQLMHIQDKKKFANHKTAGINQSNQICQFSFLTKNLPN